MALVDFCRLVDLYKLRRADACYLPIPSRLTMSTTPPPSLAEPKPSFKTPKRDTSFVYDGQQQTPISQGTSARKRQEGDTDRVEGYKRDDYDDYIREDLKSRVFVDFEVFLKSVLHVPHNWKTLWGPAIEAVKADEDFIEYHKEYCKRCAVRGSPEKPFYEPLMKTANATLHVVSTSTFEGISGNPQYYHVNDPKKLRGGVINRADLSPDLVVLHKDCQTMKDCPTPNDFQPPEDLHWANALHILEVKPYNGAICDGEHIPRLIIDGKHISSSLWWTMTEMENRD